MRWKKRKTYTTCMHLIVCETEFETSDHICVETIFLFSFQIFKLLFKHNCRKHLKLNIKLQLMAMPSHFSVLNLLPWFQQNYVVTHPSCNTFRLFAVNKH